MITAQATINLSSLKFNYTQLKSHCNNTPLIAVIKGDAYGHNAIKSAQILSDADMLAVARIEEAIEIREAGVDTEILLLEGCFCIEDLYKASEYRLQTLIHHQSQLTQFECAELPNPIKVWLKIDTGMHRVGVQPDDVARFVEDIEDSGNCAGNVNFLSHFSCADDVNSMTTEAQLDVFATATAGYSGMKSIANSAGVLCWPSSYFDMVRSGISLYGISPLQDKTGADFGLKPVMKLTTRLISVRDHQAEQPVGYSQIWYSSKPTKIGVIALGYGDGYPRQAPEGTPVWLNGRIVPIVGRVSMDMITIDLGADSEDQVGDIVEVWGDNLPIEHVSSAIGTIPYELTIKLTSRVNKRFVGA